MDGIPAEDLQRHYDGLPIVPYTKSKLIIGDASILPILAAQKVSVAAQLAESKSMTVQGDLGAVAGIVSPTAVASGVTAAAATVVSPALSSGTSVTSPPIPPTNQVPVVSPSIPGVDYWNNPYVMAAYYHQYQQQQQQHQSSQYVQNPYAQYYGQQNYYQAYANYYAQSAPVAQNPEPLTTQIVTTEPASTQSALPTASEPLIIPSYFDPNTNKQVPGTVFTVLSLDRSMEEIRSELKRYRVQK